MNNVDKRLTSYVHSFTKHMGSARESLLHAAETYARAIREYPEAAQEAFIEAYPHVTQNTWDKFRLVGNHDAVPEVLLVSDKFAARIIRMPFDKQEQTMNGDSFAVVNPTTRKIENINYYDIRPRHEKILFDDEKGEIRSIPEQVKYIDREMARAKRIPKPYSVETDALVVHQACRIGKNELIDIVEEMG